MPIPPDTRAPGDGHHVEDHNAISDELTTLAALIPPLATPTEFPGSVGAFNTVGTGTDAARWDHSHSGAAFAGALTPTAVKTSAYTAAAGDFVPVDTTSGAVTITLPSAPADLTVVAVKHVIQGGTNTVTIARGGSDVFNKTGGATSGTLTLLAQGMLLQYKASGGIWYVVADDLPLTQLDGRYTAKPLAAENTIFVSSASSASDANDGLTVKGAKATLAAAVTAITALGGGKIILGYGTFTQSATQTITVPVWIEGLGRGLTTISHTASNTPGFTVNSGGFKVTDLTLTGPQSAASQASEHGIYAGFSASAASPLARLTVERCEINSWGQNCVYTRWVNDVRVTDSHIHDFAYAGILCLSAIRGFARGNTVSTATMPSPLTNSYGIAVSRWSAAANELVSDPHSADWMISDNHVESIPWEGIDTHAGQNITVTGNTVKNCLNGISMVGCPNAASSVVYAPVDVTVTGNTVTSTVTNGSKQTGIRLTGGTGGTTVFATGTITGNTVRGYGTESDQQSGAILLEWTSGVTVTANTVIDASPNAVVLIEYNYGFSIIANAIVDTWTTTLTVAAAVMLYSPFQTGTISGSTVSANGFSATHVNTHGIYIASNSATVILTVGGNNFTACGTDHFYAGGNIVVTAAALVPDIQWFNGTPGTFTWSKPAGAQTVRVLAVGGGGQGGSGAAGTSAAARTGGGGGGGGGVITGEFPAADLSSSETVTVGAGGSTGGAAVTGTNPGNAGQAGGNSSFGTRLLAIRGFGGGAGGAGVAGAGGVAGTGFGNTQTGGTGSATGAIGNAGGAGPSGGGGGGGGLAITTQVAVNGGAGGAALLGAGSGTLGGVVDTTAPATGTTVTVRGDVGQGGGGGASSITTNAQAGANAAGYGGGGGGGGGATSSFNSGAGGTGGQGYVLVVTMFQ